MSQFIAIVAYRCLINGISNKSLDIQVQWFNVTNIDEVRQQIWQAPICCYKNDDDETVSWELAEVFAIEPFVPEISGEEIVGFIASTEELSDLT
ncbi:hypothetical protein [uncultured Rubinisphaera sp.]|uniref:hypothetical protein n=1 Tax=uncultured Rubinisphaera sp. TaxID=1678686 RepID=UPI0030DBB4C9|tara:strand:+ start:698 stop:979 length:282 start_codon:yes stop_codon:yes gene_type:complete